MTRPIRDYPERLWGAVVSHRVKSQTHGLGYWAAVDAQRKLAAIAHAAKKEREQTEEAA